MPHHSRRGGSSPGWPGVCCKGSSWGCSHYLGATAGRTVRCTEVGERSHNWSWDSIYQSKGLFSLNTEETHLLIFLIPKFIEHLLCVSLCFRGWRYSSERNKPSPCPCGANTSARPLMDLALPVLSVHQVPCSATALNVPPWRDWLPGSARRH